MSLGHGLDYGSNSGEHTDAVEVTVVAHEVHPLGGMERQLTELVLGLIRKGFCITVVARRCEVDFAHGPTQPRWVRVPGPARPFLLAYPWFVIAGSWLVRRHRRGLLHTTGAIVLNRSDLATVHFCHQAVRGKDHRVPMARSHGLLYRLNNAVVRAMSRWMERLCYRPARMSHLVAVSPGGALEVRQHFAAMARVLTTIPNGVDTKTFRPDPAARVEVRRQLGLGEADFVAIFVGGDWDRKGLRFAIDAVTETPGCHLLVIGKGKVQSLHISPERLQWRSRVQFVGVRADVNRYLAAGDAFVFPTSYETFGLAALEAAAAGLPLLATRVSGIEDFLKDGENGWFIDRHAGSIAEKLARLQREPKLRERMGAESRRRAVEYSWERVVDRYVDLYRRLEVNWRPSEA